MSAVLNIVVALPSTLRERSTGRQRVHKYTISLASEGWWSSERARERLRSTLHLGLLNGASNLFFGQTCAHKMLDGVAPALHTR